MNDLPVLAEILHDQQCPNVPDCPRWKQNTRHWDYYQEQALLLAGKLEPVIGWKGLLQAVSIILEECL